MGLACGCSAGWGTRCPALDAASSSALRRCHPAVPARLPLQVRVLQCVSVSVELLGDRLAPHLAAICNALPQVGGLGSLQA